MSYKKIRFLVISGERRTNGFMKHFDLREEMKMFVSIRKVVFPSNLSDQEMFDSFKEALQKQYHLVYLLCESQPDLVYRDKKIRVISDGQNWVMLDDYLELHGLPESAVVDAVRVQKY